MAISHSSTPSTARQEPQFNFRGVHLPAEIVMLLAERKINRTELVLLILIEALVRCRGEGCFANNRYLGACLKLHQVNVSHTIASLKEKGLIISYEIEGRRYLETSWSRVAESSVLLSDPLARSANPPLARSAKHNKDKEINNNTALPVVGGFLGKASKETTAQQLAKRIRHLAVEVYKVREPWSQAKWASDLRPLIRKHTEAEVDRVLTALEASPEAFKVHSASGFVKWFDTIKSRLEGPKAKQAPAVALDPKSQNTVDAVVARLSHLRWPKGSESQLPSAVGRSLAAYKHIPRRIRELEKEGRDGITKGGFRGFLERLRTDVCQHSEAFLVRWFTRAHKQVQGWGDWSGDLGHFVFRPDHKRFQADCADIASKYGNIKLWAKVQEAINEG